MARAWIEDRWRDKDKNPTAADGTGSRYTLYWWEDTVDGAGNPGKKRRKKSYRRKKDAENARDQLVNDLRTGTYRSPEAESTPFSTAATDWLATRHDIKGSTRFRYQRELETYLHPQWGHRKLGTIRRADVDRWVAALADGTAPTAYKNRKTGERALGTLTRPLAPNMIKHVTSILSAVMSYAVEHGLIPASPATKIKRPRPIPTDHVYLTHPEVDALATAARGITDRQTDRALVLTMAYTGMRIGEATALRVGDVDLINRRAHVRQTWTTDDKGKRTLGTPKTHEKRAVPIARFLVDELGPLLTGRSADAYLFDTASGTPINDHNWRTRVFTIATKDADLDGRGLTPHKLRHTAASSAIAAGADVMVVKTMLGHRNATETLKTYAHLFPDRLDEVTDAVEVARRDALERAATIPYVPRMSPERETDGLIETGKVPSMQVMR